MLSLSFSALLLAGLTVAHPSPPCVTNTLTGFQSATGPVKIDTSPLTPFNTPRISALNQTAWEYWYFDTVSSTDKSSLAIAFFRDPNLAVFKQGNLRVSIDATFPNGTSFNTMVFVNQSTVTTCPKQTIGVWNTTSRGIEFSFVTSSDLKTAKIVVKTPQVQGTFSIKASAPPLYPAGENYPSARANMALAPLTYWDMPIPGGNAHSDLTISGTSFKINGPGSSVRNWAPYIWESLSKKWYWTHQDVGPYTVVYWQFVSAFDGKTYTTGWLSKDGKIIFKTRNGSKNKNGYATSRLLYKTGANVHGRFADKNTGMVLDFFGPEKGHGGKSQHWHFEFTHTTINFEVPTQSNTKYSRFPTVAFGGEKCATQEKKRGFGLMEQAAIIKVVPVA